MYPWLESKAAHAQYWGPSTVSEREEREIAWKRAHPGCLWDAAAQCYVNPTTGNPYRTQPHDAAR
jgi:hypothetical protein